MKVTFYKSVLNDSGELYKSPLYTFQFKGNITEEEAICNAKKMFEEKMNISNWLQLAEIYEVY